MPSCESGGDARRLLALVAPDKFKGSLTALEVAEAVSSGLVRAGVATRVLPLADGGDGSVAAAVYAGFGLHAVLVQDAVGTEHETFIAFDGHTAVVEVANTCGLALMGDRPLAPMLASSHGLGTAVRAALSLGADRVVLALGGSASTDGGSGFLESLGASLHGAEGGAVRGSGAGLARITDVDLSGLVDLSAVELIVASDVTSPVCGSLGAAVVFGPQKGAGPTQVDELERGMHRFVDVLSAAFGLSPELATSPGSGSAGGIGFAARLLGAQLVSGAEFFLDLLGFDQAVIDADVVITGEGSIDEQTLLGKLPAVVAKRSGRLPIIAVVGRNALAPTSLRRSSFSAVHAVADVAGADTASNPHLTSITLGRIGETIGADLRRLTPS